jgi:phosphatidate cytidylyltransferase
MNLQDRELWALGAGVVAILILAGAVTQVLEARGAGSADFRENLRARVRTWWVMCAVFFGAIFLGNTGATILFALISFAALREFITLTPTRAGDHRALFWVFFVATPLQYFWVAQSNYGMFSILIPVYAFLFVPARIVLSGDPECFLERAAKIQWGLMICVY